MILEMVDTLSSLAGDASYRQLGEAEALWGGELSKEAKKERYLRSRDKGYEH